MRLNRTNHMVEMTEAEYQSLVFGDGNPGFCMACGSEAGGCEPDARNYRCESCGERDVYGIEELMVEGLILFVEETNEEEVLE